MDVFSAWQKALTLGFAIFPWLLPNVSFEVKGIIVLLLLLVSSVVGLFRLRKQLSHLSEKYVEVQEKHKALAKRFDEKQLEVKRYREGFSSVEYMLDVAIQSSRQDRLLLLQENFLSIKEKFFQM